MMLWFAKLVMVWLSLYGAQQGLNTITLGIRLRGLGVGVPRLVGLFGIGMTLLFLSLGGLVRALGS